MVQYGTCENRNSQNNYCVEVKQTSDHVLPQLAERLILSEIDKHKINVFFVRMDRVYLLIQGNE